MSEMDKLEELLKENKIKYERYVEKCEYFLEKADSRNQIIVRDEKEPADIWISCICQIGSYGVEKGLIEFYDFIHEPTGYLTAEDALEMIKEKITEWN
jgi:hypothetical protein